MIRVVCPSGEVDDVSLCLPPVLVGVPDPRRDLDHAGSPVGEIDLHDRACRRGAVSAVEEYDSHAPGRYEITIRLELVHTPTLDPAGKYAEAVRVYHWLVPEGLADVENFGENAPRVGVNLKTLDFNPDYFRREFS